ncbi:MAG: hypothetical protein Q9191_005269 [Dirinaria sp. TL-2023a]
MEEKPPTREMHSLVKNPEVDCSKFQFIHQLFRHRATDPIQVPLIAFPKSGVADYEHFTAVELDRYSNCAAWHYSTANLQIVRIQEKGYSRIALLGPTSLDWIINFFGLSLAGYTVLTLSPRLSAHAIVKLMRETHCQCLIYHNSPQLSKIVEETRSRIPLQSFPILTRKKFDQPGDPKPPFERAFDPEEEAKRPATIAHSSGSTGLPTSVEIGHGRYTNFYAIGPGDLDLNTLPLYHSFPLQVSPARMYMRKTIYFLNPDLPMTCEGLVAAINATKPGTLALVPYTLKLLAERTEGVDALKDIAQIVFTGSPCPDDLGDRLTEEGVNLAAFIGITESGFVGASIDRPPGDTAWNYVRPPPPIMKNIWPKPVSANTFEFVFLENHPGRLYSGMTNSDDPPNSFHSRDLYTPHPTLENAWKFLGRLDDRVTLINGEKVLPLPIEGRVRQHRLVKEAVVFGIGRAIPGLLLLRAQAAQDEGINDEDLVELVWPTVEAANREAEEFSQIGKDMIVPLAATETIPTTDKGTIIRAQVYNEFETQIESAYLRGEQNHEGDRNLDGTELETYLMNIAQQLLGSQLLRSQDDLFALGLNSLQAIQMRARILRDIYLGGNATKLSQNAIYEQGNIANLVEHLGRIRKGQNIATRKQFIPLMEDLISKFSVFEERSGLLKETPADQTIVRIKLSNPPLTKTHTLPATHRNYRQLGSISAAFGTPSPARIPESPIESLEQASDTGYAASKLIGERIIQAAAKNYGLNAAILRIGQVIGDTKTGMWNDSEAFPLVIRSAVTMGMLPEMKISERWLPLDTVADSVLAIAGLIASSEGSGGNGVPSGAKGDLRFYNIRSPHSFSWNRNLLPALHKTKLPPFENVPFETWIARLRGFSSQAYSKDGGKQSEAADPNQNPAIKLVSFLASHFSPDSKGWDIEFETGEAEKVSPGLRNAPKVIESGLLGKMVEVWMSKWV